MTRIESMLRKAPLFPADIVRLQAGIPELQDVASLDVERFYLDFSEWFFDSGWVGVDENTIAAFAGWLREDISE